MWSRALHTRLRQPVWRSARRILHARQRSSPADGPHTTYFQPPPSSSQPRKFWRSFWWSSAWFTLGAVSFGAVTYYWIAPQIELELEELIEQENGFPGNVLAEDQHTVLLAGARDTIVRNVPSHTLEAANSVLGNRSTLFTADNVIGHSCQLPSNMPCEDTFTSAAFGTPDNSSKHWTAVSICDGHAGPRTAEMLKGILPQYVCTQLLLGGFTTRPYIPNDPAVVNVIKRAFLDVDRGIDEAATAMLNSDLVPNADSIAAAAPAFSGSCALMAIFDPNRSVLRVANVGDSRAVLGRWDEGAQSYVAKPMSFDQTGFNSNEVDRIGREHPGEEVVDPRTGRVHGLAVTRAFGDTRWKWTESMTQRAHELLWGPLPRPGGVIKTPPYLTAEPDVTETKIQTGKNPDFLIMASDGLWDLMSSEDAVRCVQMWLEKFKPTDVLEAPKGEALWQGPSMVSSTSFGEAKNDGDDETYYDKVDKCLKWRVSSKHFVVEDDHCGMHLIKNALGGTRRNLFTSVMSVQAPLSREVRDDITVQILFFGMGTEAEMTQRYEQGRRKALQQ